MRLLIDLGICLTMDGGWFDRLLIYNGLYVLFIKRAGVLYKGRTASFINGFKNDQSYELIDEEILKIHQV